MYPEPEVSFIELDTTPWDQRMESLIQDQASIITLRGAGTVNGIDPARVDIAVSLIQEHVIRLREETGKVALLYEGDADNRERPDIGSVFGSLADIFADDPSIIPIAAQKNGWYAPEVPESPLQSAHGKPYETYVFADNLEGGHSTLTQSQSLVNYPRYGQFFVGPVGKIGMGQIDDLSQKALARPNQYQANDLSVKIISTNSNPEVGKDLQFELNNPMTRQRAEQVHSALKQRANFPRGLLFSIFGQRLDLSYLYPGARYEWVDL